MTRRHAGPLRVGLVIGQLTTGGAEGQLSLLCQGLDRTAVRPVVYCLSGSTEPYRRLLEQNGTAVRVIAGNRLRRAIALRRALVADGIQIVHAWLFIANAYAWAVHVGRRWPLITSARNCKRQGRWIDALNVRAFGASHAIIVNSARVRDYIAREYAAPAQRITVIPNAIDLDRFRPRPRPVGAKCVAMVGRLVAQKNPLLFVEAAAALRRRLANVRFILIGDGPLRPHVEAAVHAAGLDGSCVLAGERGDVHELLGNADVFWLTSDWEGLPNGVIEALACGLPVVATDVGGTAELIRNGEQGYLIARGDCEALVARTAEILSDPALHARMRSAARARTEAFGVGQMVRATSALYAAAEAGATS